MWRVIKPLGNPGGKDNLTKLSRLLFAKNLCSNQLPPNQVPKKNLEAPHAEQVAPKQPQAVGLKRTRSFLWKLVGVVILGEVGVGGVVGYCWYDKKFRDYIEQNVPYAEEFLATIFHNYLPPPPYEKGDQEVSFKDMLRDSNLTDKIKKNELVAIESKQEITVPAVKVPDVSVPVVKTPDVIVPSRPVEPAPSSPPALSKDELKKQKQEQAQAALREKEQEEAARNAALQAILTANLQTAKSVTEDAIEALKKASEATRVHIQRLRLAMDAPNKEANTEGLWSDVTQAAEWRTSVVSAAQKASDDAREELEKLRAAIKDGRGNQVTKRNKSLTTSEEQLNSLNRDLSKITSEFNKVESEAKMVSEYRDVVRKGREQFRKEIESIVPDIKLGKAQGGKMSEDDLNTLIAHAHRRIEQLQRQLAEQQTLERQRLDAALEKQRQEDDKITENRLEEERKLFQDQLLAEKSKWDAEAHVDFENELRRQLSRQAAAHSDHLTSVLRVQEKELEQKFSTDLRFQLMRQSDAFHAQVAVWVARLRGIEAAVDGRAELEKQGLRSQELWIACQTLLATVLKGNGDATKKPLAEEANAVVKASSHHPFVNLIVGSLPEEAIKEGVYTEEALTSRFQRVHRICRRVAMIDETGGTLFRYFLSYLQSIVIFSRAKMLAEDDVVDVDSLSTFDILDTAHNALLNGRLELAVRLMNQLKGEPRRVASDWIRDARLLLEAQQASQTLLAFAGASGAGAIY